MYILVFPFDWVVLLAVVALEWNGSGAAASVCLKRIKNLNLAKMVKICCLAGLHSDFSTDRWWAFLHQVIKMTDF